VDADAVSSALVVRAEMRTALCCASRAAVAVEDGARATVGSAVSVCVGWRAPSRVL